MRETVLGLAVLLACAAIVVVRAASVPGFVAARRGEPKEMADFAQQLRGEEVSWLTKAEETFPRYNWSQRDDFHALERGRVEETAKNKSVPYEDLLRAIDTDVHAHTDPAGAGRSAHAVPCKPRPFYD
jgi:hypothetical protein